MADTLDGFPEAFRFAVWSLLNTCGGSVGSGSRTAEEQQHLLDTKGAWSPTNPGAAPVGGSNHQVGVGGGAADMEGDLDCMHANAAKFGLHFPMGNEPWHVEPTPELEAQGMAFFGEVPSGVDPGAAENKAREEKADPMAYAERLLMGDPGEDEGDVSSSPEIGPAIQAPAKTAEPLAASSPFVPEASAGFSSGKGGPMSPVEVAQHLANAGFRGEDLVKAVAISFGESGWDPTAVGDTSLTNSTWGPSMGLMQIRSINAEKGKGTWRDPTRLHDPAFNAKAAYAIYLDAGNTFTDWTVFNKGIYQAKMGEARAAVAAIGGAAATRAPAALPDAPEKDLDDLLAAKSGPEDLLEGTEGEDIVADPVGAEISTEMKEREEFASA